MGPVGLVGLLVWWALGLVGPWVWWACGSGGPVGLVGPWVWWARGSTLRGPTCQGVLGLVLYVSLFICLFDTFLMQEQALDVLLPPD